MLRNGQTGTVNEAERDSLIRAMAMALRDLQHRHDRLADALHNLSQRLAIQEVAGVIEEITEGDIPERKH